jgi:hypothetical protein
MRQAKDFVLCGTGRSLEMRTAVTERGDDGIRWLSEISSFISQNPPHPKTSDAILDNSLAGHVAIQALGRIQKTALHETPVPARKRQEKALPNLKRLNRSAREAYV